MFHTALQTKLKKTPKILYLLDVCVCVRACDIQEKPQVTPRRGFSGKGKNITTKHDEETCGRKNTARMDNV